MQGRGRGKCGAKMKKILALEGRWPEQRWGFSPSEHGRRGLENRRARNFYFEHVPWRRDCVSITPPQRASSSPYHNNALRSNPRHCQSALRLHTITIGRHPERRAVTGRSGPSILRLCSVRRRGHCAKASTQNNPHWELPPLQYDTEAQSFFHPFKMLVADMIATESSYRLDDMKCAMIHKA